jgi:hypothetical protein
MKRLLSTDTAANKRTYFHSDADGDRVVTEMDVTSIQDTSRAEANDWRRGDMVGNTQKHIQKAANIPLPIYFQLLAKFGHPAQNRKEWMKWLEENPDFKATGGRLI